MVSDPEEAAITLPLAVTPVLISTFITGYLEKLEFSFEVKEQGN